MLGVDNSGAKDAGIVALKSAADEVQIFGAVAERRRGAMHRDKSFSLFDKIEERVFVGGR